MAALGAIFLFLATPVTNSISRTTEYQADIFGLNAVRKPDAFATVMLKLSTYRKLEPGNGRKSFSTTILRDAPASPPRCAGKRSISPIPISGTRRKLP